MKFEVNCVATPRVWRHKAPRMSSKDADQLATITAHTGNHVDSAALLLRATRSYKAHICNSVSPPSSNLLSPPKWLFISPEHFHQVTEWQVEGRPFYGDLLVT